MYKEQMANAEDYVVKKPLKMREWVKANVKNHGFDYHANVYRRATYRLRLVDGKWVHWFWFNPKDFGNNGGFLCQDCGVALTMNSHRKHTLDRCA